MDRCVKILGSLPQPSPPCNQPPPDNRTHLAPSLSGLNTASPQTFR